MKIQSVVQDLRMRAAAVAMSVSNFFSGAFIAANDTGSRSNTSGMFLDTRRELTFRTRLELVKKSRWCSNNLGVYRRFISGTARYSVGSGILPVPDTGDPVQDDRFTDYFNDWSDNEQVCDVQAKLPFTKLQKVTCKAMLRDGDSFVVKIGNSVNQDGSPGMPQLQWLESTLCSNLQTMWSLTGIDKEGFNQGIRMSPFGKPLAYSILQDTEPGIWNLLNRLILPASAVCHIMEPERATAVRGLPWAYHGMNSAIDLLDLTSLEKAAAKLHAQLGGAIKKKSGAAVGTAGGFNSGLRFEQRSDGVTKDGKAKTVAYDDFFGGAAILQLGLDEEFDLYASKRSPTTFAGFADFLVRDMAWGFGVAPEFIWSVAGLGGPSGRLILMDANWFFEEVQDLMVYKLCRPVYTWVIARAIQRGELPQPTTPTWWRCHWQGPAKLSIDEGRLGMLELQQLDAGVGTEEIFWASRGHAARKMRRKRILEIKDAMDECKKEGVPYDYFRVLKPGTPAPGEDPLAVHTSAGGSGAG